MALVRPLNDPELLAPPKLREGIQKALKSDELTDFEIYQKEIETSVIAASPKMRERLEVIEDTESEFADQQRSARELHARLTRSRWNWFCSSIVLLGCALAIVSTVAGSTTIYPVFWVSYDPPAHVYKTVSVALASVVALLAVGASVLIEYNVRARRPTTNADLRLFTDRAVAKAEDAALVIGAELAVMVRQAINELQIEDSRLRDLDATVAPALVELDEHEFIDASAMQRVLDFVEHHQSSALGIAGTRGAGKSTIMRRVCRPADKSWLGVYLQVPVRYGPTDFVRLLLAEVAREVLKDAGQPTDDQYLDFRRSSVLARTLSFALLALLGFSGTIVFVLGLAASSGPNRFNLVVPTVAVQGFAVAAGALAVAIALLPRRTRLQRMAANDASRSVRVAARQLNDLNFRTTYTGGSKRGAKIASLFSYESENRDSRVQRDLSHPELVAQLRSFLRTCRESGGKRLVIAVDELDKIADGAEAIAFVNGIKDLFHLGGVHFLVSVSEDALANFTLRGVPVRDVFDSSFDDVVRVGSFDLDETRALLKQRVVKFPEIAVLLCHVLSGGLPREVLRAARNCVDYRRQSQDGPVRGDVLVPSLISDELLEIFVAYRTKNSEKSRPALNKALSHVIASLGDSAPAADRLNTLIEDSAWASEGVLRVLPVDLSAVVDVLVATFDLFRDALADGHWKSGLANEAFLVYVKRLSEARRIAGATPRAAMQEIAAIRSQRSAAASKEHDVLGSEIGNGSRASSASAPQASTTTRGTKPS